MVHCESSLNTKEIGGFENPEVFNNEKINDESSWPFGWDILTVSLLITAALLLAGNLIWTAVFCWYKKRAARKLATVYRNHERELVEMSKPNAHIYEANNDEPNNSHSIPLQYYGNNTTNKC